MDDIKPRAAQTSLGNQSFHMDAGFKPLFPFGFGLSYADGADVISPASRRLHETDNSRHVDLYAGMRIYDRRPIAPFRMFVGDAADWKVPVTGGKARRRFLRNAFTPAE